MSFGPPNPPQNNLPGTETRRPGFRLPLARPVVTYALLGIIVAAFLLELMFLQTRSGDIIGAQSNPDVAAGKYWELLTSMFLHAGLAHIAFNAYALYILGRDIEGLYGSPSFTAIYFVSGLAGSAAFYLFGDVVPSVGASGAIFGLIGAEAAFFILNRQLFGGYAAQRLRSVAVLLVINLFITFTIPGINMFAHLGGLVAGFLLGLGLSPSYAVEWSQDGFSQAPRLMDRRSNSQRVIFVLIGVVVLLAMVWLGNQRWAALLGQGGL